MNRTLIHSILALAITVPGAAQAADTALKLAQRVAEHPLVRVSRGGRQGGLPLRGDPARHHLRAAAPV